MNRINEFIGGESKSIEQEDDYSDLKGMRILVAEDIEINWEIISCMLEMFGIECEHAENGQICVDMMKKAEEGSYDLIFMDVQMPQMNGLDAARAIRLLDNSWAASILNAGMNGHIAKPIDMKLVIKEIRRIKDTYK